MRILYFDCFAGASGNMILGALLDAGVGDDVLRDGLAGLDLPPYSLDIRRVDRSGINATYVDVQVPDEKHHRHLRDIEAILDRSRLTDLTRERARAIFRRLAEAEAKIHGIDVQKVHFHEVGAMDAIVDVVGACVCFEALSIERFSSSAMNTGSGFVEMAHGRYPVPPPAVAELLIGKPTFSSGVEAEMTTPTGAAIISTLTDRYGRSPEMLLEATGYGAGTRSFPGFPNVLRVMIGETAEDASSSEHLVLLETNIDDMTAEAIAFAAEKALDRGALDAWLTPIMMKKGRPGTLISVLTTPAKEAELRDLLYSETTTLGIRVSEVRRDPLPREVISVDTRFGTVEVKAARRGGRILTAKPEFESVRKLADEHGVPLAEIHNEVLRNFDALSAEKSGE